MSSKQSLTVEEKIGIVLQIKRGEVGLRESREEYRNIKHNDSWLGQTV